MITYPSLQLVFLVRNLISVDEDLPKKLPKPSLENSICNKWVKQPVGIHWNEPKTNERKPQWEVNYLHVQDIPNSENA